MICTKARNGAPCIAYMVASESITTASIRAQCTARRTRIMPSAAPTERTARIQKIVSSAMKSVFVPPCPAAARTWLMRCRHSLWRAFP